MYTKDKGTRITLRLNEEQFNFVKDNAEFLDVSPSAFLRMVINSAMSITKNKLADVANDLIQIDIGGAGRENDKANRDDIV